MEDSIHDNITLYNQIKPAYYLRHQANQRFEILLTPIQRTKDINTTREEL